MARKGKLELERVKEMQTAGKSIPEIAKETGFSSLWVKTFMEKKGLIPTAPKKVRAPKVKKEVPVEA